MTIDYDRDTLIQVLIYHQRKDIGSCMYGPLELGSSHAAHVADIYEQERIWACTPSKKTV